MNRKEQDKYIEVNLSRYTVKGIKDNPKVGGGIIGNGFDNLYPDYLNGLAVKSPTHQNILSDLNRYITGMGLVSSNPSDQAILDKFFSKRKLRKLVDSKIVQAALTLEIIRGKFEDEIKAIVCHNPAQFRVNELEGGVPCRFLYRKSWDRSDKYNYKIQAPFDRIDLKDKTQKSGLFYWYDNGSYPVYYGRPKYMSGADAIELEISAYTGVNHGVQNGMEPSKIIEIESSNDPDADAQAIRDITSDLSGVANRGKVAIRMRPAGSNPMTVTESGSSKLADTYNAIFELAEAGILKCHGIPSPSLISGLNGGKSTAFSSPIEEMEWAKEELNYKVIEDEREELLEILEPIFEDLGIVGEISFKDRDEKPTPISQDLAKEEPTELDKFLNKGEDEDLGNYDIIQVDRMEGNEVDIEPLLNDIEKTKLARAVVSERQEESLQDTPLFKVRYFYQQANVSTGKSREFCNKMRATGRVYRMEDIIQAENESVNPGWGLNGSNKYSIWLYKGGGGCKHWWERRVYLQRDNKKISVNEARRIIASLPVDERDENRLEQNDDRVATPTRFQPNGGFVNKTWKG